MSELDTNKSKSFWARPEGTTGMITLGLGALGLYFAGDVLMKLFATAITLVGQAITLTVLGVVLFALIMIITNPKVQTLVSYIFKSAMRKVTGVFVEIDPIGIMKSYINDLKEKREVMNESKGKLNGQIKITEKQIDENAKGAENAMRLAKVARDKENTSQLTVNGRQAIRLEKLNNEKLIPLLRQMQFHLVALNKYYEVTGTVIDDLSNEISVREQERNAILASHTAMRAAKKILHGGTDERELFDQAMEYVVNDFGMKMGEIENFIENSKGFVDGLDLQNGAYEEEAMARLEEWSKRADSIVLGQAGKQQLLEARPSNTLDGLGVTTSVVNYHDMLRK